MLLQTYMRPVIALFREIASCRHNFSLSGKQQIHLTVLDFEWRLLSLTHWSVWSGVFPLESQRIRKSVARGETTFQV